MAKAKATISRNTKVSSDHKTDEEMPIILGMTKQKIPIEFGYAETVADDKDTKIDDDAVAGAEDAEEIAAEEISLDDEELNPFGDKWEE